MVLLSSFLLCLVLLGVGVYLLWRRTRQFWIKLFFPAGYILYAKTRLGYLVHLWQLGRKRGRPPHSHTQPLPLHSVTIVPIAVLEDNYSYLIVDTHSNVAVLVDPSDPQTISRYVQQLGVVPKAILTTHYHWDHAGGNRVLKREFPGISVYGGAGDHVDGCTHILQDKATVTVENLAFEALSTPGHTAGHMVYTLKTDPLCLFTGDHIFIGGNGHMFEGSAETMLASIKKIVRLPDTTMLFPGHEYSWLNLKFAKHLLPSSVPIQNKLQWVRQQRAGKLTTVPSVLSEELQYNLFMCTNSPEVKVALGVPLHLSEAKVLTELRKKKNVFKPCDTH